MNIISNTCVGAYIMRDCLHQSYENPFCWSIIDASSMFNLIYYYYSINWNNWKLNATNDWKFSIHIDGKVQVKYVHYHFSPSDYTIRTDGVDLFYNKIWEYISYKYISRLKRMTSPPIFVIATSYPDDFYNMDDIQKICSIPSKFPIIINNNGINLHTSRDNIIFDTEQYHKDNKALANHLATIIGE